MLGARAILERTHTKSRRGGKWRMVKITETDDVVTLINVFTVAPEDQQRLVDVLG